MKYYMHMKVKKRIKKMMINNINKLYNINLIIILLLLIFSLKNKIF